MSKNRKYSSKVEPIESLWQAQILRQVTSKKTVVSKEKSGFPTESDALEWAQQQLEEFTKTLGTSNKRHGEQRKQNLESREQRSSRRAEKH